MSLMPNSPVTRRIYTISHAQAKWLDKESRRLTTTRSAIIRALVRKHAGVA